MWYGMRFLDVGGVVLVVCDNISGILVIGNLVYIGNVMMELYLIIDVGESINCYCCIFVYMVVVGMIESIIMVGIWIFDEVIFDGGGV